MDLGYLNVLNDSLAIRLLEDEALSAEKNFGVDKLLLRFYEYPALLAHLDDLQVKDGTLELQFYELPRSVTDKLGELIGGKYEAFEYVKNGQKRTGFRINLASLGQET
jgi:hypothetical protein